MILTLLLLSQIAPALDAAGIVQRLDGWKGSVGFARGAATCRVSRSTGDKDIDGIGCAALQACQPQYQSRVDGAIDRAIKPETRKLMIAALDQKLAQCVTERRKALAGDLATRRAGAGA